MRKIAYHIMRLATMFDVASNAQAETLGLPWAIIRFLFIVISTFVQVAQKEQNEWILKGIETVLDTRYLLNMYIDIYSQLDATPAIGHLLEKAQAGIDQGVKGVQQTLDLSALQAASGAVYNSMDHRHANKIGELQLCLAGTRVEIRRKIVDWATAASDQRVFCYLKKPERADLQLFEPLPMSCNDIAAASHGLPPVNERPLTNQFDKLIKEPLSRYDTGRAMDIRVIVIDALDECEEWGAIGHAMTFWSKLCAHTSINLRVFVTSRSDNKVGDKLKKLEGKDLQHERLEDLQFDELRQLREKSSYTSSYDTLEDDWQGEVVINELVEICQPLFIAAFTIFRDVASNPRQRLQRWVDWLNFTGSDSLTVIYFEILEHAADLDKEWLRWFNKVVKPITLLLSPLTITAMADLLGEEGNMNGPNALISLSSGIYFPCGKGTKAGSRAAVKIYHVSFSDFLLDPSL
ncbi:hypothetical protein K470DRAFT_263828 [Piedraia hortae CBS 480.64]|uniref:Nephrocystin 3-like N-terminal domain-containing protein n=1 Tax=Piedraia hortae CBS 480.64 TaxID=1314780 RepID=A0A6A7C2D9_9PEZI|nr:hypothetical protein K470DRAFT_263828 [Piedraia hortae CBS 480.64]